MSHMVEVNLRSPPRRRGGWRVKRHRTVRRGHGSLFPLDESRILIKPVEFDDNTLFDLHEFAKTLERQDPLNANVLDGFLDNRALIPQSWKKFRRIWYFGTIYEHDGAILVRGLQQVSPGWGESELHFALPFQHGDAIAYRC